MAIKTKGTQLYFVRPGTLDVVSVGCITAIENVGAPIQPRDVTPVESEWESSEPGMFSLGQIDLEIRFDPSTSGHTDVLQMYEGRVTANFAIGLGDGTAPPQIDGEGEFVGVAGRSFLTFRGWIMDVPFSFPLNENLPAAVSIMQVPSLVPGVLGVGLLPAGGGIACDLESEYDGGPAFPSEVPVILGPETGWVELQFWAYSRPDKFEIWIDGEMVLDTGYVGDTLWQSQLNSALVGMGLPPETIAQRKGADGSGTDPAQAERRTFYKTSGSSNAIVRVYAPLDGTAWTFRLGCPSSDQYLPANQIPGYWAHWDAGSLGLENGDPVEFVQDQAGNSNLSEYSPGSGPIYRTGGAGGMPYFEMQGATSLIPATRFKQDYGYTVFAVLAGGVQSQLSLSTVFSLGYAACYFRESGVGSVFACAPAEFDRQREGGWIAEAPCVALVARRGGSGNSSASANGAVIPFGPSLLYRLSDQGRDFIGDDGDQGRGFSGELYEIIVYDRVLSDTEVRSIETYLSRKYGIDFAWM